MEKKTIYIEGEKVVVNTTDYDEIRFSVYEIAGLFGCFTSKVNANIRAVLKAGVLHEMNVCRTYYYKNGNSVEQYNLEMIAALSFRIRTHNTEIFRKWLIQKAVSEQIEKVYLIPDCWNGNICLN